MLQAMKILRLALPSRFTDSFLCVVQGQVPVRVCTDAIALCPVKCTKRLVGKTREGVEKEGVREELEVGGRKGTPHCACTCSTQGTRGGIRNSLPRSGRRVPGAAPGPPCAGRSGRSGRVPHASCSALSLHRDRSKWRVRRSSSWQPWFCR